MDGETLLRIAVNLPVFLMLIYLHRRHTAAFKSVMPLGLLAMFLNLSVGFYRAPEGVPGGGTKDAVIARASGLFSFGAKPLRLVDKERQQTVFSYFHTPGAASLRSIAKQGKDGWLATFVVAAAGAPDRSLRDWLEREQTEDAQALPYARTFRSLLGAVRIEDAISGKTLFTYNENDPFRPIAVAKIPRKTGMEWQVLFATQPGMSSAGK
jgi:hypothetical protein